ncbi:MAG: PepSY-associated TM helix domain-containing protein [Xanthobacteraceae bacterium]
MGLYGRARRVLRQIHLWIALVLSLPLVVLGVTGSILVFRDELANLLEPPPRLSTHTGKPHTVTEIIAAVQARIGEEFTPVLYQAPNAPDQPATLNFIALGRAVKGPRVISMLVDLVSLDVVRWHHDAFPGFLRVTVRLHGNLLMGRAGRIYVGWLGFVMLVLGISGLILWWPGRNQLRAAFLVERGTRGLRLYRDLHGAIGIWTFVVFISVSFSGVYLAFPQTVSAAIKTLLPSRDTNSPAPIVRDAGAQRIDADRAISIALSPTPGARLISIGLPLRPEQPYRVSFAHPGDGRGVPEAAALINPWSGELIELIDPRRFAPAQTVLAWLPALHFGEGLGWVWRVLVCLSGLLPAIFAFTGAAMWLITRGARRRTAVPLVE